MTPNLGEMGKKNKLKRKKKCQVFVLQITVANKNYNNSCKWSSKGHWLTRENGDTPAQSFSFALVLKCP